MKRACSCSSYETRECERVFYSSELSIDSDENVIDANGKRAVIYDSPSPSFSLHSFFIYKWPRIVQFNPLETAWIHVMICLCQFLISIFVWHTIRYGKCTQYLVYVRIVCRCRQSHERRRKSEWAKWRAGKKKCWNNCHFIWNSSDKREVSRKEACGWQFQMRW